MAGKKKKREVPYSVSTAGIKDAAAVFCALTWAHANSHVSKMLDGKRYMLATKLDLCPELRDDPEIILMDFKPEWAEETMARVRQRSDEPAAGWEAGNPMYSIIVQKLTAEVHDAGWFKATEFLKHRWIVPVHTKTMQSISAVDITQLVACVNAGEVTEKQFTDEYYEFMSVDEELCSKWLYRFNGIYREWAGVYRRTQKIKTNAELADEKKKRAAARRAERDKATAAKPSATKKESQSTAQPVVEEDAGGMLEALRQQQHDLTIRLHAIKIAIQAYENKRMAAR